MKWKYYIGWGMALLLGMGTTACSDTIPTGMVEERPLPEGSYYLNLTLRMADSGGSRANGADTSAMPAADSEDRIHSLHVFFTDAEETRWEVQQFNVDLSGESEAEFRIPLEGPLPDGLKMYLGANLNEKQVEAFRNSNNAYVLAHEEDSKWKDDLSPYSIGYSDTGYEEDVEVKGDIAMFCTEAARPEKVDGKQNVYTVYFSLKRLVAKVLLTCKVAAGMEGGETGKEYVPLKTSDDFQGWIRREDVWYMVNVRNRSTFIMQKEGGDAENTYVIDPNQELKEYINKAFDDNGGTGESPYWELVNANFSYFDWQEWHDSVPYYCRTLPYEEKRMDAVGENTYTEGIYCPENTFLFNPSTDDERNLKNYKTAWGMITHVSVMAKFTPRELRVEYGLFDYIKESEDFIPDIKEAVEKLRPSDASNPQEEDVVPVNCGTEAVTQAFLNASLQKYEMLGSVKDSKFQVGTFFLHDENRRNVYYTYGAARIKFDRFDPATPSILGNYIPHMGGWGYYYTYIDNRSDDNKIAENFTFYKHGQVERNRYYILTVRSFSNPGSSIVNPNYIEVNTRVKDWIPGGSGDITLE